MHCRCATQCVVDSCIGSAVLTCYNTCRSVECAQPVTSHSDCVCYQYSHNIEKEKLDSVSATEIAAHSCCCLHAHTALEHTQRSNEAQVCCQQTHAYCETSQFFIAFPCKLASAASLCLPGYACLLCACCDSIPAAVLPSKS